MPNPSTVVTGALRPLVFLASLSLVVVTLYFAKAVLMPVVLAILITFLLTPPVDALERRRVPRVLAITLVLLVAIALLAAGTYLVGLELRNLADELPERKTVILAKIDELGKTGADANGWVHQLMQSVREITEKLQQSMPGTESTAQTVVIRSSGLPILSETVAPVAEVLLTFGFALLLVIFMLLRREDLRNRLLRLWGDTNSLTTMTKALDEAGQRIGRFLLVQLGINVSYGLVLTLGLWLLGVPHYLLCGLLSGALRYIPYLGVWVGAALTALLSLTVPGWTTPLWVFVLFLAMEMVWANVLEPVFQGHSIGVSEAALLISAAFWAWLWGAIGLLLAVPMTACLVVLGKFIPQLEFFHTLLGVEPALEPHLVYFQRVLARDHDEAAEVVEEYLQEHDAEETFANVLLPAVSLAKQKSGEGQFTPEDERAMYLVTQEVIEEMPVGGPEAATPTGEEVLVFGCPAGNEADEVAAQMFGHLLKPTGCRFEVLPSELLTGEVLARIRDEGPEVILLTAVFPQSIAHTRYLCKRLRAAFPDKKIGVGCFGYKGNLDKVRERLQASGANKVGTTLKETRQMLEALVRFLAVKDEPAGTAGR